MFITRPLFALLVSSCALAAVPAPSLAQHTHDEKPARPEALGLSLTEGWLEPWHHADYSRRGTPFVHLFSLEPAFLDRDLFVDYVVTAADEEDETELAGELEFALTRRLGIIVEAPLVMLNPEDGETERGLGDVAVAPRALIVETDRFLLSGNLEIAFPTGRKNKGLGAGEVGLAPSVSTWLDLGAWCTFSTQVGTEHGMETGDSEFFYSAAMTYSFQGPALVHGESESHAGHDHFPNGLTSLVVEFTGRTVLSGDDRDRSTAEIQFGVSHVLTDTIELRGAVQLPVGGVRDIEYGYLLGVIYHF